MSFRAHIEKQVQILPTALRVPEIAVLRKPKRPSRQQAVAPGRMKKTRGSRRVADVQTILLVDDDKDVLESLRALLVAHGYAIAEANDGEQALDYLRDNPSPCLILLDLMMPQMASYWAAAHKQPKGFIQRLEELSDSPCSHISSVGLAIDNGELVWHVGIFRRHAEQGIRCADQGREVLDQARSGRTRRHSAPSLRRRTTPRQALLTPRTAARREMSPSAA
jgi:hypothetical protein